MLGSKCGENHPVYFSQLLATTPCKQHATICNLCALRRSHFQHSANTIPLATLIFRKPQVMQILASERCKMVTRLSDIIPNLANIVQFADGSFVPVRWQSSKQSCGAQVLAAKRSKMLQLPPNFAQISRSLEILTPSDQNIVC